VHTEARKDRERDFHNAAFSEGRRRKVRGLYRIAGPARAHYDMLLDAAPRRARVLEFGCGQEASAFRLAQRGCDVTAIDISDVAVADARREALRRGLANITCLRMDAEELLLATESVDLVCGTGILHHLELRAAAAEIARVLRPGGRAVFLEPLGHNPLVNAFRFLTPGLRTADEHPLMAADLRLLQDSFAGVAVKHVALLALLCIPLLRVPGIDRALELLHRADALLLRALPGLKKFCWLCVIEMRKESA
jgi:SAM-dependent methyltransferase